MTECIEVSTNVYLARARDEPISGCFGVFPAPCADLRIGLASPTSEPAELAPSVPRLPAMRVLLIEDRREPDGLTRALSVVGLKVEPCPDIVVADGMLRDHAFDVAIFDLAGPESDGMEVLRGLRRRGDSTPVLVLTAGSNANERVIGLNAGADDCMSKPFELSEL